MGKQEEDMPKHSVDSFIFNLIYDGKKVEKVLYLSGKIRNVYGIDEKAYSEQLISGKIEEKIVPEDVEMVRKERRRIFDSDKPGQLIYRIKKEGKAVWIEEKLFPNKSDKNQPLLCGVIQNISSQVALENRLKKSEEKYRKIFENNLAGVFRTHVDGTILECNQAFAAILGYASPEELMNVNIASLYYDQNERQPYIEKLRTSGTLNHYISKLKRKDGRRLILDNNVSIVEDDTGKKNIIEGTLIDITALQETKEALELSEKKYRLLFEEANNAILLVTLGVKGNVVIDINQLGVDMFGDSSHEIIGLDLFELIAGDYGIDKNINKILARRNKSEKEWKFKRLDGEEFYAEVWFSKLELAEGQFCQMVVRDISERKKRERELFESRQSFKSIVDSTLFAVLIFTDEELVYANPTGEQLYRRFLNRNSDKLYEVFPQEQRKLIERLVEESREGTSPFTEIALRARKEEKNYSINVVDVVHNQKSSKLFLLRDITLEKEYHIQKHRAEIAEVANKELQKEIEKNRRTQEELLEKTAILRAFHESSRNLFIVTLDQKFRITSMNYNFKSSIKRLLDKKVKEGDLFLDLYYKEQGVEEKFIEKFRKVFNGEPQVIVSHFPTLQGEFWAETFINPIITEGGKIKEISCISHDITEKVEIQNKIKRSEASMRATLLAIPDFIFRINAKGYFTDSRVKDNDLGNLRKFMTTDEFVGKHIREVFKNKKIAENFIENLQEALASDGLHTQRFSFYLGDEKRARKRFFENRFSKISDDEVVIISRDITEAMEYESRLVESVKEKEILLKEVHHRVKNNLQVINSILNLQSSYVYDPATLEIINESQNRIRSMSYIHESLYQTKDFNAIDFQDYMTTLVHNLIHSYQQYGQEIKLVLDVAKVKLALDQAIPCGLIMNELVSNALKYAYPSGTEQGEIAIRIYKKGKKIHIEVEDHGVGLPPDFSIENSESLGLSLVDTLVHQLEGELVLKRNSGTKFLIIFEKQEV